MQWKRPGVTQSLELSSVWQEASFEQHRTMLPMLKAGGGLWKNGCVLWLHVEKSERPSWKKGRVDGRTARETEPRMRGRMSKQVIETEIHRWDSTLYHDSVEILMRKRSYNWCHHHQYVMDCFSSIYFPAGCSCLCTVSRCSAHIF